MQLNYTTYFRVYNIKIKNKVNLVENNAYYLFFSINLLKLTQMSKIAYVQK